MGWLRRWWLVLVWAALISFFSTEIFTAQNTLQIILPALRWLFPHASKATLLMIHHFIRKFGHFFEYFVFSILLFHSIRGAREGFRLNWALKGIGVVFLYASFDEFHQRFVPGRGAAVSDVLLDTCSGVVAQIFAGLAASRKHPQIPPRVGTPEQGREDATSSD